MTAAKAAAKDAAIKQSGYADQHAAATENYDEACSLASTIKAFFLAPVRLPAQPAPPATRPDAGAAC